MGFPGVSAVKNPPANVGDAGSIPGSGRLPGEGNGSPLQDSCLGNPMDRGAWEGYGPWGRRVGHDCDLSRATSIYRKFKLYAKADFLKATNIIIQSQCSRFYTK